MDSISKFELKGIEFLVRHFSEPQTIRQISLSLDVSPPGLHKGFKKLEKDGMLIGQKFGTGILYRINFDNRSARHLAALSIIPKKEDTSLDKLKEAAKLIIKKGKKLLVVSDSHHEMKSANFTVLHMSSHEFREYLLHRDPGVKEVIAQGEVLHGEDLLLDAISKASFRL